MSGCTRTRHENGSRAGGPTGLQIEQVVPHHEHVTELCPPDGSQLLHPVRSRLGQRLIPPQHLIGSEIGAQPVPRQGGEGDSTAVAGEDTDPDAALGESRQEGLGAGCRRGLLDQGQLQVMQPGMPRRCLGRRQGGQVAQDIGRGRHPQLGPDDGEVMHSQGERAIQVEYPVATVQ